jgi:hypothetical protein
MADYINETIEAASNVVEQTKAEPWNLLPPSVLGFFQDGTKNGYGTLDRHKYQKASSSFQLFGLLLGDYYEQINKRRKNMDRTKTALEISCQAVRIMVTMIQQFVYSPT